MNQKFTEDYFMRGQDKGVSNYVSYRWMPERTIPACKKVMEYLGARSGESILDYGAARGYYVRAFRELGMKAFGVDISEWAVANCDPSVSEFMGITVPRRAFDWAHLKDVAEHMAAGELMRLLELLGGQVSKGMLFIVPLAESEGGKYVRPEDEFDTTHIIRWTLDGWIEFLERHAPEFNVNASYNIHGIKPAASQVRHSCGFFTLIRP